MSGGIEIKGIKDVQRLLRTIAPNKARNLTRSTVHAVASELAKEARTLAPRDTGKLRKGIKAKRRRGRPDVFESHVVIQQKQDENSIFYWRFVEYGTGGTTPQPERPFVRPAFKRVESNVQEIFVRLFGKKLEQSLAREARRAAK